MDAFVASLSQAIADAVRSLGAETSASQVAEWLEVPPSPDLGDYALPCFKLAPTLRRGPAQIATQVVDALSARPEPLPEFREIKATGPYVNAFVDAANFVDLTSMEVRRLGDTYGRSEAGDGQTVCIDFSSPNLAKPFHIGHLCSTILGASIARLYEQLGYRAWRVNFLGDWGVQVGFQILAWTRWGDAEELERRGIDYLTELYVRVNDEAKKNPDLDQEARRLFKDLEDGNETYLALWRRIRQVSLESLGRSYSRLGVHFDSNQGEAFCEHEGLTTAAIELYRDELKIAVESRGALIVPLEEIDEELPPLMLKKSDNATIYHTRDVATAIWRWENFEFAKNIYVTDGRQAMHFRQLFAALEVGGFKWFERCVHVPFGIVKVMQEGRIQPMSTREGKMIRLEALLDELVEAVRRLVENETQKRLDLPAEEFAEVTEAVGVGAAIFWAQSRGRRNDLIFDWNQATDPKGASGPYLQYQHARLCGILRRHDADIPAKGQPILDTFEELEVAKRLRTFPQVIERAAGLYEPSVLAEYLLDLASTFSRFYAKHRVLGQEPEIQGARLRLVDATRIVLRRGIEILGMKAPERM